MLHDSNDEATVATTGRHITAYNAFHNVAAIELRVVVSSQADQQNMMSTVVATGCDGFVVVGLL